MKACTASFNRNARCCAHASLACARARAFSTSRAFRERYTISKLLSNDSRIGDVQVNGWVRTVRKQSRVTFVALEDGSTTDSLQAVLSPEQSEGLAHGSAVELKGAWVQSKGKGQNNELQVSSIEICGDNDAEHNPLQPKHQSQEFLRTVPHLRPRLPMNSLLLRLRSCLIASLTAWFHQQGFIQCHTPILTSSDCEGAGEVFTVRSTTQADSKAQPFFKTEKYLTVSGQLHLEALSQAVDKVWTLSPTFRAEKSDTPRHLAEFYMLEAELCFVKETGEVMDLVEDMLRSAVEDLRQTQLLTELSSLKQKAASDGETETQITAAELRGRWTGLLTPHWPRITYEEAIGILMAAQTRDTTTFTIVPSYKEGLAAEHERYLATTVGQGTPIFVTHYPAEKKPFYMARAPARSQSVELAACFDLLVPELCELAGGSIREHKLQTLEKTMAMKGVTGNGLEWYKDLRRYGSVSHGGFGLGFDRLICYLAGISSVRDVVSFPRYFGRADC